MAVPQVSNEYNKEATEKKVWGPREWRDATLSVLIIIGIVALGFFTINQIIEYRYKAVFLGGPCQLCAESNPERGQCVQDCFTIKQQSGPAFDLGNLSIQVNVEP